MSDEYDIQNAADGNFGLRMTLNDARAYKESELEHGRIVYVVKPSDDRWEDESPVTAVDPTTREALAIAQDVLRGYGHDAIADAIEGYRPAHEVWQEGFKAGFDNMADIAEHFAAGGSIKTIRPPVENPYAAFPTPTEEPKL